MVGGDDSCAVPGLQGGMEVALTKLRPGRPLIPGLQAGVDVLALGHGLAACVLESPSVGGGLLDLVAELRRSHAVEGRDRHAQTLVAVAEGAPAGELEELGAQHIQGVGGQADWRRAVGAPGDEKAGLDLEEVVQIHECLALHLVAVLKCQDRLVGAGCCPALLHRQVPAVHAPCMRVELGFDALAAEGCHLETSGHCHALLLVDVPDHGGVAFHLVVDVGLLVDQRPGRSGASNLCPVNEARADKAVWVLAVADRYRLRITYAG